MAAEKSIDEELRELVLDENNNVRWGAIRDKYFEKVGNSWYWSRLWIDSVREKVWGILLKGGILSVKADGNYLISGAGVAINPRDGFNILYFTKEEDAREYVDLEYRGAWYDISIAKCQKIQKKPDLTSPQ